MIGNRLVVSSRSPRMLVRRRMASVSAVMTQHRAVIHAGSAAEAFSFLRLDLSSGNIALDSPFCGATERAA